MKGFELDIDEEERRRGGEEEMKMEIEVREETCH